MDTCDFPKDNYYYYQAQWRNEPVLHLLPHWNWPEGQNKVIDVWCHSNLEAVELLLNGVSQGRQTIARNSHAEWKVPYAPGVLEARGFRAGQLILTVRRETAGAAFGLVLRPDRVSIRADGEDLSVITVEVVDAENRVVPTADHEVVFNLSGPGTLIGVGNGDPSSHEADKADRRRAFNGMCTAIVQSARAPGTIVVEATAANLQTARIAIQATGGAQRPVV